VSGTARRIAQVKALLDGLDEQIVVHIAGGPTIVYGPPRRPARKRKPKPVRAGHDAVPHVDAGSPRQVVRSDA